METDRRMRKRPDALPVIPALVLVTIALFASGCQSLNPLPRFGVGNAQPEEVRISELLQWHSGRVEVYRDFRTVFTARAVYLSKEVLGQTVDWESRSKLMSPEERDALSLKVRGGDPDNLVILLGFYTPDEKLNDLSEEKSVWVSYLQDASGAVTKGAILEADEEVQRIFMRFLKWDLSWSKLYLLKFPPSPGLQNPPDGLTSLTISGPSGKGEIRLNVAEPGGGE